VGVGVNACAAGDDEPELERAEPEPAECMLQREHVAARGDADDVVATRARVEVLDEPQSRPPCPQHHYPRFLPLRRRAEPLEPLPGLIPRAGAEWRSRGA
jgi:hypothetical protein